MAILPTAVKLHILTALACFETPTAVAAAVKEQFGLTLSRQCIEAHHPHRQAGARLHPKWRAAFDETRARLMTELDHIPIACPAYRLRQLERMLERADGMGNVALAAQIVRQAAIEAGGMYETAKEAGPLGNVR